MHPRQAKLNQQAHDLAEKLAAKSGGKKTEATGAVLWKYTDPDGQNFWLEKKRVSVRSPFSGKSFTAKPVRETLSGIGQDLRSEVAPGGAGPGGKVQTKRTKKALEEWKATSFEQPEQPATDPQTESNG